MMGEHGVYGMCGTEVAHDRENTELTTHLWNTIKANDLDGTCLPLLA